MLRIAVCDDDSRQTEAVSNLLEKYQKDRPGLSIQTTGFCSGTDLLESLKTEKYNVFLLDILMPGLSGLELAGRLRAQDEDVPLIFLTSSTDYALEAFGLRATHYILKPVGERDLFPVLDKIVSVRKRQRECFFLVSTAEGRVNVLFSSIICAESVGRALRISLENGGSLCSKTIREPFLSAVAPLLEDSRFLCAHKSYVLNMDMVETLTGRSFLMKGGEEIPIPRYKYAAAKTEYLEHLSKRNAERLY